MWWTTDVEVVGPVWEECGVKPGDPTRGQVVLELSEEPHEPWQEELERLIGLREVEFGFDDVEFSGNRLSFTVETRKTEEAVEFVEAACGSTSENYRTRYQAELEAHEEFREALEAYFSD